MYIKIRKGLEVIDCIEDPQYARYQKENRIFIAAEEADAETVISSNGKLIHKIDGKTCAGNYTGDVVTIEEATKAEYDEWVANLPEPNNPYGLEDELYTEVEQGVVNKIEEGVNA